MEIYNLISLIGIFVFFALAWALSENRRHVNWHALVWGLGLQLLVAWFLFVFPAGMKCFVFFNDLVNAVLKSATAGGEFLFGALASPDPGAQSLGFILAFQALPTIIFFSALMSILYYWNIMPKVIKGFAFIFTKLMKVSGAESVCVASNIFVGVESSLTVKPFLKTMTRSELCTVLTAGMATVASSVLALYVFSLKDIFPNIAGHLVTASFLSAPAALAMSKIIVPETETPQTLGEDITPYVEKENNLFEAIINGAMAGLKLIAGISALLIAVLGLVALSDQVLVFIGGKINSLLNLNVDWSLRGILGYVFYPLTLLLGIDPHDVMTVSKIIGERIVVTEVASYRHLAQAVASGEIASARSALVATYALCGFAHFASLAIFVGGIAALVPEKIATLSQIGFKALLAATLACLSTAAVAGLFMTRTTLIMGF